MAAKTSGTTQVFWRLPETLIADSMARDKRASWTDGFRDVLRRAQVRGRELVVEGPPVSKAMSIPDDLLEWLEKEAARLTTETGQDWSPMKVAREIWRQSRLHVLTRANN